MKQPAIQRGISSSASLRQPNKKPQNHKKIIKYINLIIKTICISVKTSGRQLLNKVILKPVTIKCVSDKVSH